MGVRNEKKGPSLMEVFSAVPDPHRAHGRHHPLGVVLALAVCAMLCREGGPGAYFLVVGGDSLVPDGIHGGDVLLVWPAQRPKVGGVCIIKKDGWSYAGTYLSQGSLRVRTTTGATLDVDCTPDQLVDAVGWPVRKLQPSTTRQFARDCLD